MLTQYCPYTVCQNAVHALYSTTYWDWMIDKAPQLYLGLATTAQFLQTFAEYPPSQKADSWSVDKLTERFLQEAETGR
jgi:hypothetical protein